MVPARYIAALFARWPKPKDAKSLGRQAERAAALFLRLKGYKILARNWRTRFGELDLVVKRGKLLVFVEVKARRTHRRGLPEEALTPQKQARLLRLAEMFLAQYPLSPDTQVRIDVIAIDFSAKQPQIRHYKGALEVSTPF